MVSVLIMCLLFAASVWVVLISVVLFVIMLLISSRCRLRILFCRLGVIVTVLLRLVVRVFVLRLDWLVIWCSCCSIVSVRGFLVLGLRVSSWVVI